MKRSHLESNGPVVQLKPSGSSFHTMIVSYVQRTLMRNMTALKSKSAFGILGDYPSTGKWLIKSFQISYFLFFALFQKVTTEITIHYKSKKTIRATNYINHEMWNVRSDQRSLGFRVGHCHVQLTGLDFYIELQVRYNGKGKLTVHKVLFTISYKNNRND